MLQSFFQFLYSLRKSAIQTAMHDCYGEQCNEILTNNVNERGSTIKWNHKSVLDSQ